MQSQISESVKQSAWVNLSDEKVQFLEWPDWTIFESSSWMQVEKLGYFLVLIRKYGHTDIDFWRRWRKNGNLHVKKGTLYWSNIYSTKCWELIVLCEKWKMCVKVIGYITFGNNINAKMNYFSAQMYSGLLLIKRCLSKNQFSI